MILYFIGAEPGEQALYQESLQNIDLRFAETPADVGADAEGVCVFVDHPLRAAFFAAHPKLRFIAARSTAVDHIELPACEERCIDVSYVPIYGTTTVAEHTFALILALARDAIFTRAGFLRSHAGRVRTAGGVVMLGVLRYALAMSRWPSRSTSPRASSGAPLPA